MFAYEVLKSRHRQERVNYPKALSLRVHRALSWLKKAEESTDNDSKFLFYWIAFNSAYAQEFEQRHSFTEQGVYKEFLNRLVNLDKKHYLQKLVWEHFATTIRVILDNEFILQAYWDFHAGRINEQDWRRAQTNAKNSANQALSHCDTSAVLSIIFSRLYTLRNQIMHGGATFNSSANRQQLKDCTTLLKELIPIIIHIMMDAFDKIWGDPVYPLIEN